VSNRRRICVVTGTRAEYALLRPLLLSLGATPGIETQLIATGMHLSPEFGLTINEIEADGFRVDRRVEMLLSSDTPAGIAKSTGLGIIGFGDALAELRPDVMVVLGDRFEILAAAIAALFARIPVAHLHGGELTEGAFDDAIRHAVTKLSHLHFVAAEPYRARVLQLGEDPARVFLVGGMGVDSILTTKLLERGELQSQLGVSLAGDVALVTFHPVTLEEQSARGHVAELLAALEALPGLTVVFTAPNADTDGRIIAELLEEFCRKRPRAFFFTSLGRVRYLSLLKHAAAVIGNSSSGLTEAPTMRVPTINIGERQKGRLRASSVVDCAPQRRAILDAFAKSQTPEFKAMLASTVNPYGSGGAAAAIAQTLASVELNSLVKKSFRDLPAGASGERAQKGRK
jgi:GDP/UDP-N,N'-diacetylbacillosamine 2-epimerase (hydrolysing)